MILKSTILYHFMIFMGGINNRSVWVVWVVDDWQLTLHLRITGSCPSSAGGGHEDLTEPAVIGADAGEAELISLAVENQ